MNRLNILHNVYPNKSVAVLTQRCGRISRIFKGKTNATVYDYLYSHPMFYYQFFNPKKRNYRLKSYLECTRVHEDLKILLNYIYRYFNGGTISQFELDQLEKPLSVYVKKID